MLAAAAYLTFNVAYLNNVYNNSIDTTAKDIPQVPALSAILRNNDGSFPNMSAFFTQSTNSGLGFMSSAMQSANDYFKLLFANNFI